MKNKKILAIVLGSLAVALISFTLNAQQTPSQPNQQPPSSTPPPMPQGAKPPKPMVDFEHVKNLKVLPKKMTSQQLQQVMRMYSSALGVRCGFCHAGKEAKPEPGARMELDFASDAKPEKGEARKMIVMTRDINAKYLQKIDKSFEEINCVSCHHGAIKPMISPDSLPHRESPKGTPAPAK